MFDWNDEELANIIWGEPGETDDHTVPYPESSENYRSKKEWNPENTTVGPTEQSKADAKSNIYGKKLGSSSNFKSNYGMSASGCGTDSWTDMSGSSTAKTDQNLMGTVLSNSLKGDPKYSSSKDANKLDHDPETFHSSNGGKEQSDLIDYGWANIGSFDDLDRIFSDDDPIFGDASLSNTDELWYSKDVTSSPPKSFPLSADSPNLGLTNTCEALQIKREKLQNDEKSLTLGYGSTKDSASLDLQNAQSVRDDLKYAGSGIKPVVNEQTDFEWKRAKTIVKSCVPTENTFAPSGCADKVYLQKKVPKDRKRPEGRTSGKLLQNPYGTWSPGNPSRQFQNQLPHAAVQSCIGSQQQLQGPESLQGQHIANTFVTPSAYGNYGNPYTAMPVMSHVHSSNHKQKPLLAGYANPINKSADSTGKHLTMTPHEKIVKLRRRQQMQALLAIQKQQQQFGHHVSCSNRSVAEKSSQGSENQHVEGIDAEIDNLSAFPLIDPNSPVEQDDSNTISVAVDNYAVEDTILYQLQDIIAKLDIRIRLCIRDSLFRLAQSAMQRHYGGDTSSTYKSSWDEQEASIKPEIEGRIRHAKIAESETETNPIDRTVAHLLFHRPLELSEKYFEAPESPPSTKTSYERKTSENTSALSFSESSKQKHKFSYEGSAIACPTTEQQHLDHLRNSPCIDTLDHASNPCAADAGGMEASK